MTRPGELKALDVKMIIDDNALFRHPDLAALRDEADADEMKLSAHRDQLNFVPLDGDIGLVVERRRPRPRHARHGQGRRRQAGQLHGHPHDGEEPRHRARLRAAARQSEDPSTLLINVHGGGMQSCDTIAEGLGIALRRSGRKLPIVMRLAGQNADFARNRLANFGCAVIEAPDMGDGRPARRRGRGGEGLNGDPARPRHPRDLPGHDRLGRHPPHLGMMEYGTTVVAGVRPGKGGRSHLDLPVFDTVAPRKATRPAPTPAIVFVPPATAGAAMIEAIEAEMPLVVVVTERVPTLDMVRVSDALKGSKTTTRRARTRQGVLAPDICKLGVMATGSRTAGLGRRGVALGLADERGREADLTTSGSASPPPSASAAIRCTACRLRDCLELFLADPRHRRRRADRRDRRLGRAGGRATS